MLRPDQGCWNHLIPVNNGARGDMPPGLSRELCVESPYETWLAGVVLLVYPLNKQRRSPLSMLPPSTLYSVRLRKHVGDGFSRPGLLQQPHPANTFNRSFLVLLFCMLCALYFSYRQLYCRLQTVQSVKSRPALTESLVK